MTVLLTLDWFGFQWCKGKGENLAGTGDFAAFFFKAVSVMKQLSGKDQACAAIHKIYILCHS